jgi:hypothetical protein
MVMVPEERMAELVAAERERDELRKHVRPFRPTPGTDPARRAAEELYNRIAAIEQDAMQQAQLHQDADAERWMWVEAVAHVIRQHVAGTPLEPATAPLSHATNKT